MSILTSYPGVYVEELASGSHTITPVSTSITSFVGRAPIGPVAGNGPNDGPMTIFSYGDFQRVYGGLQSDYPMSYAVQDFFNNGGSEAVIARIFEPNSVQDSGVAKLGFPVSPPMLPDGWMLAAAAKAGDTTLTISAPTGGTEGEPVLGMTLYLGSDAKDVYTVSSYTPAGKTPATITVFPPLAADVADGICTSLTFAQGPTPAGWSAQSDNTKSPLVLTGGQGLPSLGDILTVGTDTTNTYQVSGMPTVTPSTTDPSVVTVSVPYVYTGPTKSPGIVTGAAINIAEPQPSPLPVGWNIQTYTPGTKSGTLTVINGAGNPLPNDEFTVGDQSTYYKVTDFTPANGTKSPATITFEPVNSGDSLPQVSSTQDFCYCCVLVFNRPAPVDYTMTKTPKIGETSLTVQGTTGVVDVGDNFTVQGDETVYSVRTCSRQSGSVVVQFLPEAATAFSGEITIAQPLALEAASPGKWGNMLTAQVDTKGINSKVVDSFAQYDLEEDDLFNITLQILNAKGQVSQSERYLNVTVKNTGLAATNPNRLDRVLETQSMMARVSVLGMSPPASGSATQGVGGDDGTYLSPTSYLGDEDKQTGIYMLDKIPIFNLLCIPPDRRISSEVPVSEQSLDTTVVQAAAEYSTNRRAFYIVDPPASWTTLAHNGETSQISPDDVGITGVSAGGIEYERNAAVYFPRVYKEDILMNGQKCVFAACGMIAGAIAANDVARGVWKAPAGQSVGLAGVTSLEVNVNDSQNGILNPLGINCLRSFPVIGPVIWGARTLRGADQFQDDYKYIPVRRLTLYIEDALIQGTQWAVFEPNDEALWSSLRLSAETFLADLAKQGAFYDYKVTCDATTTTQTDISLGVANLLIQIAPVDPAEFIVIEIQQIAGSQAS